MQQLYIKLKKLKEENHAVFRGLTTNMAEKCEQWTKYIIKSRQSVEKYRVNIIKDDPFQFWVQQVAGLLDTYFYLPQRDLLNRIISACEKNAEKSELKFTANDALRIFGIILCEDFRDKVPLLYDGEQTLTKNQLDSFTVEIKALWHGIYTDFLDTDKVYVSYPLDWFTEKTIAMINSHSSYDENDMDRVSKLKGCGFDMGTLQNWFKKIMVEYTTVLVKYQTETGGGDPNFLDWDKRDSLASRDKRYMGEHKSDYLTYIHMYNKELGFILTKTKESIPANIAIDGCTPSNTKTDSSTSGRTTLHKIEYEINAINTGLNELTEKLEPFQTQTLNAISTMMNGDRMDSSFDQYKKANLKEGKTNNIIERFTYCANAPLDDLEYAKSYLEKEINGQINQIEMLGKHISEN